jgi:hypothetical protein
VEHAESLIEVAFLSLVGIPGVKAYVQGVEHGLGLVAGKHDPLLAFADEDTLDSVGDRPRSGHPMLAELAGPTAAKPFSEGRRCWPAERVEAFSHLEKHFHDPEPSPRSVLRSPHPPPCPRTTNRSFVGHYCPSVEWAPLVISGIAIALAIGSFALSVRTDKRQQRAERREERRERREEDEALARRRGRPVVVPQGGSGGPTANPVRHDYAVQNGGQATITELWLWIEDTEGNVVSTRAGGPIALAPGETLVQMSVEVRQPLPEGQSLMVQWTDQEGERIEPTGIRPPRHM